MYLTAFAVALALNPVWGNAHMPLYKNIDEDSSTLSRFVRALYDSFMDAVLVLLLYLVPALDFQVSFAWFFQSGFIQPSCMLGSLGGVVATLVEWKALKTGRWQYTDKMPIVPFVGAGLSPFVQLMILPSLVALITYRLF